MIQAIDLQKAYNGTTVLDLPEFKINNGEVFGLVGNNGAGKTTTMNLFLNFVELLSHCCFSYNNLKVLSISQNTISKSTINYKNHNSYKPVFKSIFEI